MTSFVTFLIAIGLVGSVRAENTLRFVTALWRHGDRAPSRGTFPTDTANNESTWPQGFGELSEIGMRQHQHLGNYLRTRYVEQFGFLSANYSAKEVYVRSTDYNRTLMSALSHLAGMYPTGNRVDYLENIPIWQPIPVHSQPRETDPMLWMDYPCPKAEEIYHNVVLQSDEFKQIEAENQLLLDFLMNKTGVCPLTLDEIGQIWDPLNCERIHNRTHQWPNWVNESIFEQLTNLTDISNTFSYADPRLQRFRGGLLFNDIAARMDAKINRPEAIPTLKYYIYSVHDTTLTALMENFGDFNGHLPEYASCVLVELHEDAKGTFSVQTWYVNESWPVGDPVRLKIKECDDQSSGVCDLATYVKLAASKAPTDFDVECALNATGSTISSISSTTTPMCKRQNAAEIAAIVLGVTTGVFLIAFLIVLILYIRATRRIKVAQRGPR